MLRSQTGTSSCTPIAPSGPFREITEGCHHLGTILLCHSMRICIISWRPELPQGLKAVTGFGPGGTRALASSSK